MTRMCTSRAKGRSLYSYAPRPCLPPNHRQTERLAAGPMRRPLLLRHVGRRLQHLVLADARLTDVAALAGAHCRLHSGLNN